MTPQLRLLMTAVALAAAQTCALAQGRATLEVLPTSAGTTSSRAAGLNDAGQVVGSMTVGSGPSQAVLWTPGSAVRVVMGNGIDAAEAVAINRHGEVAGSYRSNSRTHSFAWSDARGTTQLLTPDGASSRPVAINSQGVVAGSWQQYAVSSPVLWSATGVMQELTPRGDLFGLNDAGQAVGNINNGSVAYLWQADGSGATLPGTGRPSDINDVGQVVGSLNGHGYVWAAGSGTRSFGQVGWQSSDASAINNAGQVVGIGRPGNGPQVAMLWREGFGMSDLSQLGGAGFTATSASDINAHAQVAGTGTISGGQQRAYLMTLHPDWRGGDGQWDDATGQRWNWAGTGTAAARVGAMHDVVIDPGRSATVWGSASGSARTLRIGGTAGYVVTLDLNGGTTTVGEGLPNGLYNPALVSSGGVLRGNGRVEARQILEVEVGGRVQVDAGQAMQLSAGTLYNFGLIRAQGVAHQQARLELGGPSRYSLYNGGGALIQAVHADLVLSTQLSNFGQLSLQASQLTMSRPGSDGQLANFHSGIVAISFGDSVINGEISNDGLVVVSNGARASFHGAVDNRGELRVSAGGAANFFGDVVSSGHLTGDGELRFEAAFSTGAPQSQWIDPDVTFSGRVLMQMEGDSDRDHFTFARTVRLSGASLALSWDDSSVATAGMVIDLFDWSGGLSGTFTSLALPTLADGLVWNTGDLYLGGSLSIAPVPELRSWALLLAGLGFVALRLRRGGEMGA